MNLKTEIDININIKKLQESFNYWEKRHLMFKKQSEKFFNILNNIYTNKYNSCFINRIMRRHIDSKEITLYNVLNKKQYRKSIVIVSKIDKKITESLKIKNDIRLLLHKLKNEATKGKVKTTIRDKELKVFLYDSLLFKKKRK